MRRIIQVCALAVLACVGFASYTLHDQWSVWVGAIGIAIATVLLIVINHRVVGTWRGLIALSFLHGTAQAWLYAQWDLWNAPEMLARILNGLAGVIAFATLIAMLGSLILLLTLHDASVIALASAWLGCPIFLLATMTQYRTLDQLDQITLREQLPVVVLLGLLIFIASAGMLAFLIHFARLLMAELRGRA